MGRGVSSADGSVWVHTLHHVADDQDDWQYFLSDLRAILKHRYPSLNETFKWLGREDRAILENNHCTIGVSEYCGVVAVWCVPKEVESYYSDSSQNGLHEAWCYSVEANIGKLLQKNFAVLTPIGTASNGETFYRKAE